jgi:hypothetical protein
MDLKIKMTKVLPANFTTDYPDFERVVFFREPTRWDGKRSV